jgi:hypothetical protein
VGVGVGVVNEMSDFTSGVGVAHGGTFGVGLGTGVAATLGSTMFSESGFDSAMAVDVACCWAKEPVSIQVS